MAPSERSEDGENMAFAAAQASKGCNTMLMQCAADTNHCVQVPTSPRIAGPISRPMVFARVENRRAGCYGVPKINRRWVPWGD